MRHPLERELVDLAKRGDEEAFDALVRHVGDRCMAIASWILRDADLAEDALQGALVTAWRELPGLLSAGWIVGRTLHDRN